MVYDRANAEIGLAFGLLLLRIDRRIVASYHKEDRLRATCAELAVLNAPEDVLGAIAAEAEVEHRLVAGEVRRERSCACRFPVQRQLVANEDDILLDGAVGRRSDLRGMAFHPPSVKASDGIVRTDGSREHIRRSECKGRCNKAFQCFYHGRDLCLMFWRYCTASARPPQLPSWVKIG